MLAPHTATRQTSATMAPRVRGLGLPRPLRAGKGHFDGLLLEYSVFILIPYATTIEKNEGGVPLQAGCPMSLAAR